MKKPLSRFGDKKMNDFSLSGVASCTFSRQTFFKDISRLPAAAATTQSAIVLNKRDLLILRQATTFLSKIKMYMNQLW
jgi:hypothetical protein